MIIETLKKNNIFSSLKNDELQKIAKFFEKLNFKNNDYIFTEGDLSEWFYITAQGKIKIIKHTIMGKDIILEIM